MRSSKARILILIKGLGVGGAEKLISEGAKHWDTGSFSYTVAYALPWKNHLVADLESLGIRVRMIGDKQGLTPRFFFNLRRLVRKIEPDLIHAHLPSMGVAARLISPVPVVYTEHNIVDSYRLLTRVANRLTYAQNAVVIAVSDAVADSVRGWSYKSLQVIPNGVSPHIDETAAQAARTELGLPQTDSPLVAHVGNIKPGKGHDVLIAAASRLCARRPDVTIVSIGGEKHPGDLERVRESARAAGVDRHLKFTGRRPDALAFVAAADVFVNPSWVEGLPVAVLEAMAAGTPVVATDAGGVPRIVRNGQTGILVPSGDADALADGIARLLDDPDTAGQLARKARELVEREYGLEPMVRAVESVYCEVLDV